MKRCGLLLLAAAIAGCTARGGPPNVVVFMVDTLRADALGCYGSRLVETPHVDAFAAGGVRFAHAFAQASWTRASIASVFTGTYPWTHAARDRRDRLSAGLPTLAELLAAAGYRTGAVVSNPNIDTHFGFARGFGEYVELHRSPSDPEIRSGRLTSAAQVVDASLAWLDRHGDEPFFLYILAIDPHDPYSPPPPYDRKYHPKYNLARRSAEGAAGKTWELDVPDAVRSPGRAEVRALYDGEVSYIDEQFGRLLAALAERRFGRDTAIVFTADHGEEFYDHGAVGHGVTLYDEVVRIPLIVRHPGAAPGQVVDNLVELRDVFATVLAWAGVPAPAAPGARDLTPCLAGPCTTRDLVVAALDLDGRQLEAVRGGRYKMISWRDEAQLFDLRADPRESVNQLARLPAVASTFRAHLGEARQAAERLAPSATRDQAGPLDDALERSLRAMGYIE